MCLSLPVDTVKFDRIDKGGMIENSVTVKFRTGMKQGEFTAIVQIKLMWYRRNYEDFRLYHIQNRIRNGCVSALQ